MQRVTGLTIGFVLTAIAGTATAEDVVIWTQTKEGPVSTWLTVEGDQVTTVATRAEAVTFDGKTLWALQRVGKTVDTIGCDSLEEEGRKAKPTGTATFIGLRAVALGGKEVVWLVAERKGNVVGEVWNQDVTLLGGTAGLVSVQVNDSGFACGAHGYVEHDVRVMDVATGKPVATDKATDGLKVLAEKVRGQLFDEAVKAECREKDAPITAADVRFDGLELIARDGAVHGKYTFLLPRDADWAFNCDIFATVESDVLPGLGFAATSAAVTTALKHQKATGTVGHARMTLTGEAREKALKAFSDTATVAKPPAADTKKAAPKGSK